LALDRLPAVAHIVTAGSLEDIPGVEQPEALFLSPAKQLLLNSPKVIEKAVKDSKELGLVDSVRS
jgi:hypothetical protein